MIIKLQSRFTKFKTTSVKSYYDPALSGLDSLEDIFQPPNLPSRDYQILDQHSDLDRICLLEHSNKDDLFTKTLDILVKHGRGRPRKHPIQAILIFTPNIYFVIDDTFFTIDENSKQPLYTFSRQKKIIGLLEKKVFEVVDI